MTARNVLGVFCLFLFVQTYVAAPNCNAGLTDANYFCFDNGNPFTLQISDGEFRVLARAWNCEEIVTGNYRVQGRDLSLHFDDCEQCLGFTHGLPSKVSSVVFRDSCLGFEGVEEDNNHTIECTEVFLYDEENYQVLPPLEVDDDQSSSASVVTTSVFVMLFAVAYLF